MNFTWTISNLDRKTSNGFVYCAHWQCTGADGDLHSSVYATCSFDGDPTVPYADLTPEMVLGWVWEQVDKAATEQSIADRIEALKNPVDASGLPWASAE
jgi:hypothetical protein